jgi:hypothetical protein
MTFPAGAGVVTNNFGPGTPSGSAGAPPYGTPPAAANVADQTPTSDTATYNFTHAITSTQESINNTALNAPIQGLPYNTNSSQVLLAGVPSTGFTYFSSVTKG